MHELSKIYSAEITHFFLQRVFNENLYTCQWCALDNTHLFT